MDRIQSSIQIFSFRSPIFDREDPNKEGEFFGSSSPRFGVSPGVSLVVANNFRRSRLRIVMVLTFIFTFKSLISAICSIQDLSFGYLFQSVYGGIDGSYFMMLWVQRFIMN